MSGVESTDRPGGLYGFDQTIRWADGRTDRSSWSEALTAAEATERMGPVPPAPESPFAREVAWLKTTLHVIEHTAREALSQWPNGPEGDEAAGLPGHIFVGAHLMRNQPSAVLARVAAERAILAEIERSTAAYPDFNGGRESGLEEAASWLAWGHRFDAEGYDMAWAPYGATADA